jgi:hypothetical protein
MRLAGILLIALGIAGLVYGGTVDRHATGGVGAIEAASESREQTPVSPLAGGVCLVAGAALVVGGRSPRSRPAWFGVRAARLERRG